MMAFKVLTIALLTVCAGENRFLVPKRVSSRALPAQILNKNNLLYTYGEGHQYSTPSPLTRTGSLTSNLYQKLQYAPMHSQVSQKYRNTAAEHTKVLPTLSSAFTQTGSTHQTKPILYRKDHLEPRIGTIEPTPDTVFKCYNPGHNVPMQPMASRSPGHNAVYRNFPNMVQGINPFKTNDMRVYEYYPNLGLLSTTMLPFHLPHKKLNRPFNLLNDRYLLNPNLLEEGLRMEKKKRQFSPYAKLHRLHLNIARVYSPGQMPPKPAALAEYPVNFGSMSEHSEDYMPPIFEGLPGQKTILYPIGGHKNYRFHIP